ncbi:MAG: biotin transporter BioY [candidate division WOR-3 bacterium]
MFVNLVHEAFTLERKVVKIFVDLFTALSFALITGLFSKIKMEMWPVPFTMQTVAVISSGLFLGKRLGMLSQIFYILLGLSGIPVFARGGGLHYLFSPTFGYLIGFPMASYLSGFAVEYIQNGGFGTTIKLLLFLLISNFSIYLSGIPWLAIYTGYSLIKTVKVGFLPFILGDLFKVFFSLFIFRILSGKTDNYGIC